jgi:phosphotriesterase-related protein
MVKNTVNTVSGPLNTGDLGIALMHEHPFVEYTDGVHTPPMPDILRDKIISTCSDHIDKIRAYGVQTVFDPTTVDLGRNILLLCKIAEKTGFNIICCTGIYSISSYIVIRKHLGGGTDAVARLFIKELTEGIEDTGIKAGFIKVVTGYSGISMDEKELLIAAANASVKTNARIITHTDGVLGDTQQEILVNAGVPAQHIMIGHCCGSTDFNYHMKILKKGSFLGFDRFGMESILPDETRVASVIKLINAGYVSRLILSHDSVWYWKGGPVCDGPTYKNWTPTNIFKRVIPMLKSGGVTDEDIKTMLIDNPKKFLSASDS